MKHFSWALVIAVLIAGAPAARAEDPSVSIPDSPTGRWQGKATEVPGIYSGPVSADVTLELKPDGTYSETWKQGSQEQTTTGTWRVDGRRVILTSSDRSRERLSLQRRGDALYTMATDSLPNGRETTLAIELHPAP